jgi:hypothetical protein
MSLVKSVLSSLFVVSALVAPTLVHAQGAAGAQQLSSPDIAGKLKTLNISVDQNLIAAINDTMKKEAVGTFSDENLKTYLTSKAGSINGSKVAMYILQYLKAKQNGAFNGIKKEPNLAQLAQEYAEGGEVITTVTQMYARFNTLAAKNDGKDPRTRYLGVRRSFFKEQAENMGLAKTIDGKVGSKLSEEENKKAVSHAQQQEQASDENGCGV